MVNEEGFVHVLINKLLFLFRGMFWLCVVGRRGKWWFLKNCYNCGPSEGICLKRSKYISLTIGILPLIYIWHSFQWLRTHTYIRRENPLSPKYLIQVKLELRLKIFNQVDSQVPLSPSTNYSWIRAINIGEKVYHLNLILTSNISTYKFCRLNSIISSKIEFREFV